MKKGIFWPIGISVFLLCFVSYLISIVVFSRGTKVELVSPNYYEEELKYQNAIDAQKNANSMEHKVTIDQDSDQNLVISFPKEIDKANITGIIKLLRPDDSGGDLAFPLTLNSKNQHIVHRGLLRKGAYKFSLSWNINKKDYMIKEDIYIKSSM
ncbi:MAG: FixH family protein [Solitalea-like symbiont of Acarus siro]